MYINYELEYKRTESSKSSDQTDIFVQNCCDNIMESKLIVKNFGPIKEVELDLRNVNVFIGPQSTGKSALAKIYTIFKAPRKFFYKIGTESSALVLDHEKAIKEFKDVFVEYNILSFLKDKTEIKFESELHIFEYKDKTICYEPKLFNTITALEGLSADFEINKDAIIEGLSNIADKFVFFNIGASKILLSKDELDNNSAHNREYLNNLNSDNCKRVFDLIKSQEADLSTNTALYIPAERSFSNIIKKSALNLIKNKVPIPEHILSFGAELEKLDIKEIDLDFIQKGLIYKNINDEDKIYFEDDQSIMLTEAASGIQSLVPILTSILNKINVFHKSFVIEEPELNLFPSAQYELIQCLESNRRDPIPLWEDFGSIHTYTTHSPYILSALNNLLYAHKVRQKLYSSSRPDTKSFTDHYKDCDVLIKKIVKEVINPASFTAYQIKDGHAELIFDRENGLIDDNYIDEATDVINEDFDKLMELTK
ncbi:MAG TPA: AAA family ATPase [Ferruginibacter sp.]|jgi:predicted ATPase|nr:AAA family ATPase [Ferruginibacter sp.]